MKNYYSLRYLHVTITGMLLLTVCLANAQNKIVISGAGSSGVNGVYILGGTSNGKPYYTKGNYRVEYRDDIWYWGFTLWEIWDITNIYDPLYSNWNSGTSPVMSGWEVETGSSPAGTISIGVDFTGGSSYSAPTGVPNTNNNPIGRYFLTTGTTGSTLTSVTVQFSGTASGINNVKLWSSADNSFSAGSDVQLSSKTYASSVTFNSLSSSLEASGTYYFITADLNSGAAGSVAASINNTSAFSISSGSMATAITNATLSSASVPLPIQLLSFTAQSKTEGVMLQWTTAKEESFAGFEPERSVDGSTWNKMTFIAAKADNTSATTAYAYTDNIPVTGHVYYRLKMIDADGVFKYSRQLTVVKNEQHASLQNYPNPFSRQTNIAFQLPVSGWATLKVFNNAGIEVSTVINKKMEAGNYTVSFDGAALPAGVYHYTLRYGKEKISGTMLLKQ